MRSKYVCANVLTLALGVWVFSLLSNTSSALADEPDAYDLRDLEVHGFLSQGFIKSTDNNYLADSKLGSFEYTEGGINLTKQLMDNLRTGVQLFTQRLGPTGNFDVRLDWFYLDYHASDALGLRVGRVKLPFGLYNDISDVDAGRAPVLLPQSIYPIQNRNFLLAHDGVELYGYNRFSAGGALDYRVYGGTISIDDLGNTVGSPVQVQSLEVPYLVGGRLLWETPLDGLRVGLSGQALRLDVTELFGATAVSGEIPAILWVSSAEYVKGNLLLASEYSRWHVKTGNSSNTTLFPEMSATSERGYVMGAYRLNRWLQPALYYSVLFPNVDMRSGRGDYQHDVSATLRFDINPFWLVKLEGHYMRGTAGLSTALNGNTPASALADSWGVFLIKTTAYF